MRCDRIVFFLFYIKYFLVKTPIRNVHLVKLDRSFSLINHHYFKTTAKYRSLNSQEWVPLDNNYYHSALYIPTKVALCTHSQIYPSVLLTFSTHFDITRLLLFTRSKIIICIFTFKKPRKYGCALASSNLGRSCNIQFFLLINFTTVSFHRFYEYVTILNHLDNSSSLEEWRLYREVSVDQKTSSFSPGFSLTFALAPGKKFTRVYEITTFILHAYGSK